MSVDTADMLVSVDGDGDGEGAKEVSTTPSQPSSPSRMFHLSPGKERKIGRQWDATPGALTSAATIDSLAQVQAPPRTGYPPERPEGEADAAAVRSATAASLPRDGRSELLPSFEAGATLEYWQVAKKRVQTADAASAGAVVHETDADLFHFETRDEQGRLVVDRKYAL
ncbi:hypothetical protein T492DRAFT_859948 [Pavlovales sp. CCMP2436]|nr:hypothetical protein T492DRAFT_859948 [Pavlovales sp. CCMP2436]